MSWFETVQQRFGQKIIHSAEIAAEREFLCDSANAPELLEFLKSSEGGGFDHLSDLTAIDDTQSSPRFKVIYELISMQLRIRCRVVAQISMGENPVTQSVVKLWPGANWLEREVFDMFGIRFEGHPDPRRILMPPSFQGYPLRKDFIHDYRQSYPVLDEAPATFDPFGNTLVKESES